MILLKTITKGSVHLIFYKKIISIIECINIITFLANGKFFHTRK